MLDPRDAQLRVNRIQAFRAELDALAADGVSPLSAEQRAQIAAYHDALLRRLGRDGSRIPRAGGGLSRGVRLASLVAAMAVTAAIYSLVAQFWDGLALPLQATLLCAFPLTALVGVELSARRERTLYVASLFALVAYGTFWLAAGVLSSTFNIPVTPLLLWTGVLFGLALALPYGFHLVLAVALATFAIAVSGSVFDAAGIPWTSIAEYPELTTATALGVSLLSPRLAPLNPAFAATARITGLSMGLAGLLLLSTVGTMSLLPLSPRAAEGLYQVITLSACVAVMVVGVRRRWNETANLGAAFLTVFLLLRFFDWFWALLPRFAFFLLLAAAAFAWALALRRVATVKGR
jgi:hypothetical protein